MITRDIIVDNLLWHEGQNVYSKADLCDLIDRCKYLLVNQYHVRPKQTIALAFSNVSFTYLALVFAAGELGLKLIILDYPLSIHTIHKTKAAFFAPIDIGIESTRLRNAEIHHAMMERYCSTLISEKEILETSSSFKEIWCNESDILLCASTSGSTGEPSPVLFTHQELLSLSTRNIDVFKFRFDSPVGHTKNMHHASSLLTVMLPAMMRVNTHVTCSAGGFITDDNTYSSLIGTIKQYDIEHIQMINYYYVKNFVSQVMKEGIAFEKPLLINISGYTVPDEFYEYTKNLNIQFISHFGSVDTGIPLLVNHVTNESTFKSGLLGKQPDDFYSIHITNNGSCIVESDMWDGPRVLSDIIQLTGDEYYHIGRTNVNRVESLLQSILEVSLNVYYVNHTLFLVIWDVQIDIPDNVYELIDNVVFLQKQDFTLETKVSTSQLKGYLECL